MFWISYFHYHYTQIVDIHILNQRFIQSLVQITHALNQCKEASGWIIQLQALTFAIASWKILSASPVRMPLP